jgi:hypothetical protein
MNRDRVSKEGLTLVGFVKLTMVLTLVLTLIMLALPVALEQSSASSTLEHNADESTLQTSVSHPGVAD